MNKKILVISILAVLMLVAISFSTAVSSNTTTDEQRESPLFRIRTRKAIGERLDDLKDTLKAKFIGERVFFLPFQWLRDLRSGRLDPLNRDMIIGVTCFLPKCSWPPHSYGNGYTCDNTNCLSPYHCTAVCNTA